MRPKNHNILVFCLKMVMKTGTFATQSMVQAEHNRSDTRASDSKTDPARGLGIALALPSRLAKVGAELHWPRN